MSQSRVLATKDIQKLTGSADCPSCGNRILLLNLNKSYYCPKCNTPISFTVKRKQKKIKIPDCISSLFPEYSDKWTLVYSVSYPLILSIIPTFIGTQELYGEYFADKVLGVDLTIWTMMLLYVVTILTVLWKSLPSIIAMFVLLSVIVGILMLFGIPPQASIPIIGFIFAFIFLAARIGFVIKNWRAVTVGMILFVSAFIPYLYSYSVSHLKLTIFTGFFIYHALVANICLIWLYRNSYTPKQAVLFIGTTPLIIAMLVLPFINKFGIDIDGIFDAEIGEAPEPIASLKENIAPEDPMTAPVQGDAVAPEVGGPGVPEIAVPESPVIIASPNSGVPHGIFSDYYIESEIIADPQSQPVINLKNIEVDYYASQQSPDTCAIASQRMILADQTGVDYSEIYLLKYAEKCGYYIQGQGTPQDLTGQLLKDSGLEVIEADSVSLEQIDIALQHNYSVSENLDPNEYISPRYDSLGNPVELPDEMGHNVKVVSINKDLSGAYTSVVIDDPVVGPHIEIPVADYMNARSDFGNTVFAKKIV
jgi:hypothetical protein